MVELAIVVVTVVLIGITLGEMIRQRRTPPPPAWLSPQPSPF